MVENFKKEIQKQLVLIGSSIQLITMTIYSHISIENDSFY